MSAVDEQRSAAVARLTASTDRLSIPFAVRLPLSVMAAGMVGFGLGATHGGSEAGLRFRAENAHRFPTTQVGWFLYHKSKNYHAALGGIKEGLKMGLTQGVWAGLFCGMEECVDRGRAGLSRQWRAVRGRGHHEVVPTTVAGHRDFLSSILAGLGTAGAFSAWHRFPLPTAVRVARLGAKAGLAFGLAQDLLSLLRGRRLGYVEFARAHILGLSPRTSSADAAVVERLVEIKNAALYWIYAHQSEG